jgi:hypothetical protein
LERLRGLFVAPVTIPLRGNTTTRRHDDATKTRILASPFDGLLAASGGSR